MDNHDFEKSNIEAYSIVIVALYAGHGSDKKECPGRVDYFNYVKRLPYDQPCVGPLS